MIEKKINKNAFDQVNKYVLDEKSIELVHFLPNKSCFLSSLLYPTINIRWWFPTKNWPFNCLGHCKLWAVNKKNIMMEDNFFQELL